MKRAVLVTLDGSPLSETILPVVAELVTGTDTGVTLLRVGELPEATFDEPVESAQPYVFLNVASPAVRFASALRYAETKTQAIQRREQELLAYLDQKARALRERGIEVRTVVDFGNPAEAIIEHARRPEIALVAMATHGRTGLRTLIFGSVAGRVLYSGVRPVMMTRPQQHDRGWLGDTGTETSEERGQALTSAK